MSAQVLDQTPWEAVAELSGKVDDLITRLSAIADGIAPKAPEPLEFVTKKQLMAWLQVSSKTLDNILIGVPFIPTGTGEKIHKRYLKSKVYEALIGKMRYDAGAVISQIGGTKGPLLKLKPAPGIARHFAGPGGPGKWQGKQGGKK